MPDKRRNGIAQIAQEFATVGTPAFPLPALSSWRMQTAERKGLVMYMENASDQILDAQEYIVEPGIRESAFENEVRTWMMELGVIDRLHETVDQTAADYEQTGACVTPAGIAYRSAALVETLNRQNDEGSRLKAQWLVELGKCIREQRTARGLTRQMLARLSTVSRDDIFCLEHGMLNCDKAREYVPKLLKFIGNTRTASHISPAALRQHR